MIFMQKSFYESEYNIHREQTQDSFATNISLQSLKGSTDMSNKSKKLAFNRGSKRNC